ncbi:MAG: PspC domain-containing protein [Anaerolineae bacterium]
MSVRLYRSEDDRMLAGVCGGLADYFEIDATLVRAVFVILALLNGVGLLIYLALAIVVPRQGVASEDPQAILRENVEELGETAKQVAQDVQQAIAGGESDSPGEESDAGADEPAREDAASEAEAAVPTEASRAPRQRGAMAGLILVGLGLVFLGQNLGLLRWWDWSLFWPLVLIVVGAALLWQRIRG